MPRRIVSKLSKILVFMHNMREDGWCPVAIANPNCDFRSPCGSRPIQVFIKNTADFIVAAICLFLFGPAMALIAAAIKFRGGTPVLVRETHYCAGPNQTVDVLKFSTHRPSRLSGFLLRTKLDALPQLWNVVRAELSFVGLQSTAYANNSGMRFAAGLNSVKPGLISLAQIHGCRDGLCDDAAITRVARYDFEYVATWSVWLDLKIIFMMPLSVLLHDSDFQMKYCRAES